MAFKWTIDKLYRDNSEISVPQENFTDIDSMAKLEQLYHKGRLVKILLMPEEFGGIDSGVNSLYVTQEAQKVKQEFDDKILSLSSKGKKLFYNITPEYNDRSYIASKLHLSVTGDVLLEHTIEIW